MKHSYRFPALVGMLIVAASGNCFGQTGPTVWVSPSLVRIGQTDAPTALNSVALDGARGEYLDSQIIVTSPAGGLTNVNVQASDLTGPGGAVIPSPNYSFYREMYVNVNQSSPDWQGSNRPLPPGMYADILLPFIDPATGLPPVAATYQAAPFMVAAGQNQPVWFDLFVPRGAQNTPPGAYTGTIQITATEGNITVPVTVTIWNFELPITPSMYSDFNAGGNTSSAVNQMLLQHRIMPDSSIPSDEPADISFYGLLSSNLNFWSGATYNNCQMWAAPSVSQFQAAQATHQSSLFTYDYSADEIGSCPDIFPTMIQWAQNMHAANVSNLVTMPPTPALFDDGTGTGRSAVDIWAVETDEFANSASSVAQALAKGDKVWSYTTLVQDSYTPKWEIDFLPINFRVIQGWINPVLGYTGILYWSVGDWSDSPYTNIYSPDAPGFPGEAQLMFPGVPAGLQGLAPSMRLKWIRDGAQDYEYFQILQNLGEGNFAVNVGKTVGPDWTNWTRDPNVLAAARDQLGTEIDSLSSDSSSADRPDHQHHRRDSDRN